MYQLFALTLFFTVHRPVSGHQHNPFAAVTIGPPSETRGEVKGFSLVYSGNFILETDLSELGRLRYRVIYIHQYHYCYCCNRTDVNAACIIHQIITSNMCFFELITAAAAATATAAIARRFIAAVTVVLI